MTKPLVTASKIDRFLRHLRIVDADARVALRLKAVTDWQGFHGWLYRVNQDACQ